MHHDLSSNKVSQDFPLTFKKGGHSVPQGFGFGGIGQICWSQKTITLPISM